MENNKIKNKIASTVEYYNKNADGKTFDNKKYGGRNNGTFKSFWVEQESRDRTRISLRHSMWHSLRSGRPAGRETVSLRQRMRGRRPAG